MLKLHPQLDILFILNRNLTQAVICTLVVMACLKEQIKTLEKIVLTQVQLKPDFQELITIAEWQKAE